MKQLLFILLTFLSLNAVLQAHKTNPHNEAAWNMVQERLFNGKNTKAYRFYEDIRIELDGAISKEDSSIVKEIILELENLIETVRIKLVDSNGNFIISIDSPEKGSSTKFSTTPKNEIKNVEINIKSDIDQRYQNEKYKFFQYNIITKLTKTFVPRFGNTTYYGFFDTSSYEEARRFTELDQELIRNLYSKDFYKNLRRNTTKKWGYLSYLNLRYENLLTNLFLSLKIILVIFGFLHFLSNESKRVKHPTFLIYIRQRAIILLIIPFIFSFVTKTWNFQTPVIPSFGIFMANFVGIIIYAFFTILLIFHTERYVLKRITDFWQQQLFIFFNTILAIVFTYSIVSIPFVFLNKSQSFSSLSAALLLNTQLLLLVILIAVLRVFYNLVSNRIQSMVNQKDVEIAKMKELKNQAELNALHSRINPHFLYNSLNSIASLAHINPDKTENMAMALSELFRYSINKENKTFVSVSEELEMVKKYLEIEKTRFGDKLEYSIQAEDNVKETLIPKFLIQPLAENAIKHGLSKIKNTGKIIVEVKRLGNELVITIFDNGPDFPKEPVSGYGLQNLHDKLDIIYGKDAFINWENGENKHFKITLKNQF